MISSKTQYGDDLNSFWKKYKVKFHSSDIMRLSLASESSRIIDGYLDKRQKEIVSEITTDLKPNLTLDAGVGAGRWIKFLNNISKHTVGTDISIEMLNSCKRNVKDDYSLIKCSHDRLPFKRNTFDLVFCCFSLLYLKNDEDFNRAVENLIEITKDKGIIIFIEITSRRRSETHFIARRTPSYIIDQFSIHNAQLKNIYGYYFDLPIKAYQYILIKIFKFIKKPNINNIWEYIKNRGGYTQKLIEFPLKTIIYIFHPLNKFLAKRYLESFCPEKIMVFQKISE